MEALPKCTRCDQQAKWLLLESIPIERCTEVASDYLCTEHWSDLRAQDPDTAYKYTPAHVVLSTGRSTKQ